MNFISPSARPLDRVVSHYYCIHNKVKWKTKPVGAEFFSAFFSGSHRENSRLDWARRKSDKISFSSLLSASRCLCLSVRVRINVRISFFVILIKCFFEPCTLTQPRAFLESFPEMYSISELVVLQSYWRHIQQNNFLPHTARIYCSKKS